MAEKTLAKEIVVHPRGSLSTPAKVLYVEPLGPGSSSEAESPSLVEYWYIIRHRLPLICFIALLGLLAGILISFIETPVYQARVSLEIQNPSESALNVRIGDLETEGGTISPEAYLPTQVQILQSLTLRQRTLDRLKQQQIQADLIAGPPRPSWLVRLGVVSKLPAGASQPKIPVETKVKLDDNTRIVEILCDSPSSQLAAAYANALANEYIDSNLQAHSEAINRAHEFLMQQLDEIRANFQKSEDELQAYGRSANLMFTADKESVEQEKLKETQAALSEAQAVRIQKQSDYQIANSSAADSVPQVLDNTRLSDYQSQLAGLRRQLAELSSQFTPEHPRVMQIQAQIDDLEGTLKKEQTNIVARIRNDYEAALTRERLLNSVYRNQAKVVTEQTQKTTYYNILERDADTNRKLYDSMLEKAKEADVAAAMRGNNARIIDPAEPPPLPYKPNFLFNTLIGAFSGILVGVVVVLGRQTLDRSLKAPGEAFFHLRLPELGVIPAENPILRAGQVSSNGQRKPSSLVMLSATPAAKERTKIGSVELSVWHDKSSVIAESFRSALTSILISGENGVSPRTILVSSASRAEGKTTVVTNLGIALAEIKQKVLIIDADMRQPRINEVFNLSNSWGLSDLLREKSLLAHSPLEALVQRTEIPNLYVMTSGPRTNSITNLLHSDRMVELLDRLRMEFSTILIDTPPMLQISDARILGRLVDAAILVFRAGKTSRDVAMAAKQRMTDDGIPVIGTILNAWDLKTMNRYGYGGPYSAY